MMRSRRSEEDWNGGRKWLVLLGEALVLVDYLVESGWMMTEM